jgi:hypothetical protein
VIDASAHVKGHRPHLAWLVPAVMLALVAASCTRASNSVSSGENVPSSPSSSGRHDLTPAPVPATAETSTAPQSVDPTAQTPSAVEALKPRDWPWHGKRLELGTGRIPWGGRWTMFLYRTVDGVGVGVHLNGGRPAMDCCLTSLRSGMRPMGYIETSVGRGVIIAHVSPDIELVKYDCIQCPNVEGTIPRIVSGRSRGVAQIALVFVTANAAGGNDGNLIAFDPEHHLVDRDWIGLPPACTGHRCPVGLTWGTLVPGGETS